MPPSSALRSRRTHVRQIPCRYASEIIGKMAHLGHPLPPAQPVRVTRHMTESN